MVIICVLLCWVAVSFVWELFIVCGLLVCLLLGVCLCCCLFVCLVIVCLLDCLFCLNNNVAILCLDTWGFSYCCFLCLVGMLVVLFYLCFMCDWLFSWLCLDETVVVVWGICSCFIDCGLVASSFVLCFVIGCGLIFKFGCCIIVFGLDCFWWCFNSVVY